MADKRDWLGPWRYDRGYSQWRRSFRRPDGRAGLQIIFVQTAPSDG